MNKKEKVINRLVLDGKNKMEAFLKDFNTEKAVNEFVESPFFSMDVNYDVLWKRFKEYCFEFNTNL